MARLSWAEDGSLHHVLHSALTSTCSQHVSYQGSRICKAELLQRKQSSLWLALTGRDCERDVKRDRRKRKAAAEALTFASHGMNGSEGEAAGLLPAQQKPKRVRRRKSRDQVIQPIAVDLQQVAPDQAAGAVAFDMPHLQNTAAAVQLATTAEGQLAQLQAAELHAQQLGLALGVALNPANAQQLLALLPQDGSAPVIPITSQANGVAGQALGLGAGSAAPAGGLLVAGGAGMPAPVWIQQPIQPAETEYETASDATLDAVGTEPGEVVSSVRRI